MRKGAERSPPNHVKGFQGMGAVEAAGRGKSSPEEFDQSRSIPYPKSATGGGSPGGVQGTPGGGQWSRPQAAMEGQEGV